MEQCRLSNESHRRNRKDISLRTVSTSSWRIQFGGTPLGILVAARRRSSTQHGGAPTVEIPLNGRSDNRIVVMQIENPEQEHKILKTHSPPQRRGRQRDCGFGNCDKPARCRRKAAFLKGCPSEPACFQGGWCHRGPCAADHRRAGDRGLDEERDRARYWHNRKDSWNSNKGASRPLMEERDRRFAQRRHTPRRKAVAEDQCGPSVAAQ